MRRAVCAFAFDELGADGDHLRRVRGQSGVAGRQPEGRLPPRTAGTAGSGVTASWRSTSGSSLTPETLVRGARGARRRGEPDCVGSSSWTDPARRRRSQRKSREACRAGSVPAACGTTADSGSSWSATRLVTPSACSTRPRMIMPEALPTHPAEPTPHRLAADDVQHAGLVLQVEEGHPAGGPGSLPVGDQPGHPDPALGVPPAPGRRSGMMPCSSSTRPQVLHRMVGRARSWSPTGRPG